MKRLVAFAWFLLAAHVPVSAKNTIFELTMDGNKYVCADMVRSRSVPGEVRAWVLGYWSGLNTGHRATVGTESSANGVVGEVKLFCERHPSVKLVDAIEAVYFVMSTARK
jgi:hypothetical protein